MPRYLFLIPNMRLSFYCIFLLTLFTSCRKDRLRLSVAERVQTGTDADLNTAVVLENGTIVVGGGSRFGSAFLLKSRNAGTDWQLQALPEDSKGWYGIAAAPDNALWACGYGLNIYRSTNYFDIWQSNRVPGPYVFCAAISAPSPNRAFVALSATTDTGGIAICDSSFRLIHYVALNRAMRDIQMFNGRQGMAVGSGICVRTTDSGKSWQTLPLIGDNFTAMHAIDDQTVLVCGLSGYIFKTTDGGQHWQRLRNGGNITYPRYRLWDICFRNALEGFASGENGLLLFTNDGGEHWSEYEHFTESNLYFVRPLNTSEWLVGGAGGTLFRIKR
jgi:photosystem II stability/assembly factor-like uncharacterized protein